MTDPNNGKIIFFLNPTETGIQELKPQQTLFCNSKHVQNATILPILALKYP